MNSHVTWRDWTSIWGSFPFIHHCSDGSASV